MRWRRQAGSTARHSTVPVGSSWWPCSPSSSCRRCKGPRRSPRSRPWQVSYIALDDHKRIFEFLAATKRLELPRASWVEPSGLFQHRADMTVAGLVNRADPTADLEKADRIWLQTWMHRNVALAHRVVRRFAASLPARRSASPIDTALDNAVMTAPAQRDPVLRAKLNAVAGRVL